VTEHKFKQDMNLGKHDNVMKWENMAGTDDQGVICIAFQRCGMLPHLFYGLLT